MTNEKPALKTYYIWVEGYRATGEEAGASLLGTAKGENFQEACKNLAATKNSSYWNKDFTAFWGCRVFETEEEARKRYG